MSKGQSWTGPLLYFAHRAKAAVFPFSTLAPTRQNFHVRLHTCTYILHFSVTHASPKGRHALLRTVGRPGSEDCRTLLEKESLRMGYPPIAHQLGRPVQKLQKTFVSIFRQAGRRDNVETTRPTTFATIRLASFLVEATCCLRQRRLRKWLVRRALADAPLSKQSFL